ncbi:conserved hypothetical protein [Frankia canadensis]|uniref:FMN hydroxy acid dehydrogenase domain-containing protein n=1 Tax=Frankia canadensis TaxID=1836972 RepID=A0A2I2L1F6_9ACTN|nr:alpha-hydroxy acid oxidase [Frankia canadensis]SNQ51752.1 conserved hypothetical protein [Frankia canadensis]SOU59042.1 conserved hypothetical protein [Frankia canadensis]
MSTDSAPARPAADRAWSVADVALIDEFVEGASGTAAVRNEAGWQQWSLVPRVFRDVRRISTAWTGFGLALRAPVLIAPTALGLVHPQGEREAARGIRAAGMGLVLSQGSTFPVAEVAEVSGPFLQQVYLTQRRDALWPFLDRAVDAGATALALTVDQPAAGVTLPFRASLARLAAPGARNLGNANFVGVPPADLALESRIELADIGLLADRTGLPVVVKGVLHPDDAVAAVEAGAAGVVVSNHGGRQLGGTITSAEALPRVVAAVGGRVPVLVDGGIRQGEDVLRALVLGADAVLVGRPAVRALRAGGADGLRAALETLRGELELAMALAGTPDLAAVTSLGIRHATQTPYATDTPRG